MTDDNKQENEQPIETLYNIVSDPSHPHHQQAKKEEQARLSCHTNYCMMFATYAEFLTESNPTQQQLVMPEWVDKYFNPKYARFSYEASAASRRKLWGLPPKNLIDQQKEKSPS